MKDLRKIIKEHLLLEKRIDVISSEIQLKYNFEIVKGRHAEERSIRPEITDSTYNQRPIENADIKFVFGLAKRKVAEKIASHYIQDGIRFIIRSLNYELSMVIEPYHVGETLWVMGVVTVFRESPYNKLKVGENQLVIEV